ncbi:hypothetical protein QQF73_05435 [Marinobacter sp. M216]|uniref:Uncharacterized protein n=1 Tax=Marinobacter albus TaxID=3030833 RepID=A0ABT7HAX4_9GAMM|nr:MULTISPECIES: hypothetical protein [unclassified Marinobacter]MBW7470670.1 hypothetical protein [Marinobacter sp. F4218]MDK9557062.1 hypothetical protein [Marinobacter sp. M216]
MNKRKNSIVTAGILASALLAASPFALADHHGGDKHSGYHGKPNMEQVCENFRENKGRFKHDERQAKREARWSEMAERLQLTEEQLETWEEIRQEKQEKYEQRRAEWQKELKERCEPVAQ